GPRHHHVYDHHVGVGQDLHAFGNLEVGDAQVLAELQVGHVDGDPLRDVGGQTLDLQLAGDEVEDAALGLDPDRRAVDLDGDVELQRLVEGDLVEVGMEQPSLDRLDLALLEDDLAAAAPDVEVEQGVLARSAP